MLEIKLGTNEGITPQTIRITHYIYNVNNPLVTFPKLSGYRVAYSFISTDVASS